MLKMIVVAAMLLLSGAIGAGRLLGLPTSNQQIDNCETVTVACPEAVDEHSEIKFQASVARAAGPLPPLQYHWSLTGVPKARIKSGRGTDSIVVTVPRRAAGKLTVTVTVIPVVKGCNNQASCSVSIARRP